MQHLLEMVASYPRAALALVAATAFAESLAIVGTFVPAAVVMFAAGAMVAHGVIGLWPAMIVAVIGASLGDALSYELGRRRGSRIRAWPLLQRRQAALDRAQAFVDRHGGKSVVLARFMGALRAFVPLLAGFGSMPRARFYLLNIASACLWAPAHLLPGVVFGNSVQMAHAVGGRLLVLVLLLALLLWMVALGTRAALRFAVPRVRRVRDRLVQAAHSSGRPGAAVVLALLDPARPGSSSMLLASAVLLAAAGLLLGFIEDVVSGDPLVQLDLSVFNFLQGLRVERVDRWMVRVTEFGSVGVILPLILVVLGWLLWKRSRRTAGYWVAAAVYAEAAVQLLKVTLGRSRPLALYQGVERFSFPSGHATMSTVVLGTLAFLISRGQSLPARLAVATMASTGIALVAFSRLYLGAHWFSDVVAGICLGAAWIALFAMVYTQRGIREPFAPRALAGLALVTVAVAGTAWSAMRLPRDLARYQPSSQERPLDWQEWIGGAWQRLPARRMDLAGEVEEQLALQWACSEQTLRDSLRAAQWRPAADLDFRSALQLLVPHSSLSDWPVLPRLDQGKASRLVFVRGWPRRGGRDVLRLWRSGDEIRTATGAKLALWRGALYSERMVSVAGSSLRRLETTTLSPADAGKLLAAVPGAQLGIHEAGGRTALIAQCAGSP